MENIKLSEKLWLNDYLHFFVMSSYQKNGKVDFEDMNLYEMPISLQSCYGLQDKQHKQAHLGAELLELYYEVWEHPFINKKVIHLLEQMKAPIIFNLEKPYFNTPTSFRAFTHEDKKFCTVQQMAQESEVEIFAIIPFQASQDYIIEHQQSFFSLLSEFKKMLE